MYDPKCYWLRVTFDRQDLRSLERRVPFDQIAEVRQSKLLFVLLRREVFGDAVDAEKARRGTGEERSRGEVRSGAIAKNATRYPR